MQLSDCTCFYFKYDAVLPVDVVLEVLNDTVIKISAIYAIDEDLPESVSDYYMQEAEKLGYEFDVVMNEFQFSWRWPHYPVALSFEKKLAYTRKRIGKFAQAVLLLLEQRAVA